MLYQQFVHNLPSLSPGNIALAFAALPPRMSLVPASLKIKVKEKNNPLSQPFPA